MSRKTVSVTSVSSAEAASPKAVAGTVRAAATRAIQPLRVTDSKLRSPSSGRRPDGLGADLQSLFDTCKFTDLSDLLQRVEPSAHLRLGQLKGVQCGICHEKAVIAEKEFGKQRQLEKTISAKKKTISANSVS
jgi:hypothetical protein